MSAELHISRYDDAQRALCNPHLAQALYEAGGVIMDDVLLTLHGPAHKDRRHLALRVFKRDFARYYEREVFPATLDLTFASLGDSLAMDLVEFGYRVTMNLTADFAGIDRPSGSVEETGALLRLVRKFSEGATLVHSTRDHEVVRGEVRAALSEFDALFFQPSRARRERLLKALEHGEIDEDALPRDMLTVLLRNEDRLDLPLDCLRREIAFYLQAGSHSTGNSMVHAMHELFTWGEDHPAEWGRLETDPEFLQRCVHESLRLHPASPVAWRRAAQPIQFPWGARVEVGDRIIIDLAAANCDESVFGASAAQFDPHRALSDTRVPPFGLTFGVGVHNCLGRDLDGGLVAGSSKSMAEHQFGIVTLLVKALLDRGVRPDTGHPPERDTDTQRSNWGRYPVRLEPGEIH